MFVSLFHRIVVVLVRQSAGYVSYLLQLLPSFVRTFVAHRRVQACMKRKAPRWRMAPERRHRGPFVCQSKERRSEEHHKLNLSRAPSVHNPGLVVAVAFFECILARSQIWSEELWVGSAAAMGSKTPNLIIVATSSSASFLARTREVTRCFISNFLCLLFASHKHKAEGISSWTNNGNFYPSHPLFPCFGP